VNCEEELVFDFGGISSAFVSRQLELSETVSDWLLQQHALPWVSLVLEGDFDILE
jgi:hypothetical protein